MNEHRREDRARQRFWRRVRKDDSADSCWIWTGGRDADGYGVFYYNGRSRRAHRVAYEWEHGKFEGELLHRCDTPSCIRPSHVRPGTQAENLADARQKGRKDDRGSANSFAKLTDSEVREMRALYAGGGWTQHQLAARFGIHQTHVSDVVTGKRWSHVR